MPPIDPSIALQVKPVEIADPLQNAYKAQLLKSAMGQNDMNMLQQQQLRQTMADNQGIRAVLGDQGNYEPHPTMPGLTQLKPEARQRLGAVSPEALFKYNKDLTDQQQGAFQLQEQQQKAKDAQLKHAENVLGWAEKLTIGQLDAYEGVLKKGGSPGDAIAEANRVGAIIHAQGTAAVPELGKTPLQPFDPSVASANLAKTKTYKDRLAEMQGGDGEEWSTTPHYDGQGNAYVVSKSGKQKWLKNTDGTPVTRQQEYSQPVAGQDAEHNPIFVSGGKYAGPGGAPQMQGRSGNDLFPSDKNTKPLTESETNHTGFWVSMNNARDEIAAVEKKVPRLPFVALLQSDDPGFIAELGNTVKRGLMSSDSQRAYTAWRKFISDDVYMTSGKAITATEWPRLWSIYVPMPNDTDEEVALKLRFRDKEIERARIGGGRGIEMWEKQQKDKGAAAAPPPQPKITGKTFGNDGKVTTDREEAPAAAPAPNPAAAPAPKRAVQLPPEVRKELQEGQETEFSNGTVWTLENGEPKQLR